MKIGIINDTAVGGHPGTQAVMQTLTKGLISRGITPTYFWPAGVDWRPHAEFLREKRVDAIVVNGEGSIHNSENRPRSRYLCEVATFAKETLRVPAVLVNSTLYNLRPQEFDHLKNFDRIYVRETSSQAYLQTHGIEASFVPDLSFFDASLSRWGQTPGVGMFVSDSIVRDVSLQLKAFARSNGSVFMKMKPPKGSSLAERVARLFRDCRKLLTKAQSPAAFDIVKNELQLSPYFETFLNGLGRSETVVTGRLHTVTLALALRKPFIAIESNTPKIRFIVQDALRSAGRVFEATPKSVAQALQRTPPAPFSVEELAALDEYMTTGEVAKERMFSEIRSLIVP